MSAETTGVHTWVVLWKAAHAVSQSARKHIESLELCFSDFAVLEVLLHKGPLPVNSIGSKVLLTSGSVTTAVDRLEQRGLVERANDASDRRTRIVHLTREGRKLIGSAFTKHAQVMEQVFTPLSGNERTQLVRLLKKVGQHAETLNQGGVT